MPAQRQTTLQTEDWKILQGAQKLLLQERQKVQEIKGQLDAIYNELNCERKAHEEQLASSKYILKILQADNLELQHERDAALTEAEDLRRKKPAVCIRGAIVLCMSNLPGE